MGITWRLGHGERGVTYGCCSICGVPVLLEDQRLHETWHRGTTPAREAGASVQVGQVYQDLDRRSAGDVLLVRRVLSEHALCLRAGRVVRVRLDRLAARKADGSGRYYELVGTEAVTGR